MSRRQAALRFRCYVGAFSRPHPRGGKGECASSPSGNRQRETRVTHSVLYIVFHCVAAARRRGNEARLPRLRLFCARASVGALIGVSRGEQRASPCVHAADTALFRHDRRPRCRNSSPADSGSLLFVFCLLLSPPSSTDPSPSRPRRPTAPSRRPGPAPTPPPSLTRCAMQRRGCLPASLSRAPVGA